MTKTKKKVMSLILATGLVVSSIVPLSIASAATKTETGELTFSGGIRNLVSEKSKSELVDIDEVIGSATIETYDHHKITDVDFVKASHVSGDRLVSVEKKGGEFYFAVRGNASGKEVINVRYETTYDRDDKEVTVRANKDITFYAHTVGEVFVGKAGVTDPASRPGSIPTASVNQKYLDMGVYFAQPAGDSGLQKIKANYSGVDVNTVQLGDRPIYVTKDSGDVVTIQSNALDMKKNKIFSKIVVASLTEPGTSVLDTDAYQNGIDGDLIAANTIRLVTTFKGQTATDEDSNIRKTAASLVGVGSNTLKIKLGTATDTTTFSALDKSQQSVKVSTEKKYNADLSLHDGVSVVSGDTLEINKKSGKTYANIGSLDWDDSDAWKEHQKTVDAAVVVGSYDKITSTKNVMILGGSIGNLSTDDAKTIVMEDGSTGGLSAGTVEVQAGTVGGTIDGSAITITDGKVKAIDDDDAVVIIEGGEITGNINGKTVSIDADDTHIAIGGKITANGDDDDSTNATIHIASTSDASVTVNGEIKGILTVEGENVALANINADYRHSVVFDDFTGTVGAIVNTGDNTTIEAKGESVVSVSGKLTVDSVEIEEESKLVVEEAEIASISGDGQLVFPAGKLHVTDEIDTATKLVVSNDLAVGATAFTSNEDTVDGKTLNTIGFTLESKSENSTTDKHVIGSLVFAGLTFDKSELRIAKGYSDSLTIQNYPDGLSLPTGAQIEWDVDANDDYITVTVDEATHTATIQAIDFNADYAVDNGGNITATVVDANGEVIENLLQAAIKVTVLEKPDSTVTLDTSKPVTISSDTVYQYIAASSSNAVLSAVSSDAQIATVELFNAADARGYKFQINAVAEGKVTITTTDENGASAVLEVIVAKPAAQN